MAHGAEAGLAEQVLHADIPELGHLTPRWLLDSLRDLDKQAGGNALKGLPVVVSHIKYSLTKEQPQKQMLQELEAGNDLGVRFVIPEQGTRWHFK